MSLSSRAYKILCSKYRAILNKERTGRCSIKTSRNSELRPVGLEPLEPRILLSGVHYDRVDFLTDPDVQAVTRVDFDDVTAGTDLTNATIDGVTFQAPGAGPLTVIESTTGVRNALEATSGTQVLSPGGSDVTLEDDDLSLVFDQPVHAAGLDVLFDVPDGFSLTGVTFLDEDGQVLFSQSPIPAPDGASGSQFVGYVAEGQLIKSIVIDEFDPSAPDENIAFDSLVFSDTEPEDSVLFINVNGSSYNNDGFNFFRTVETAGADVEFLNLSANGQAASLLSQNDYDQIWVFDLSSGSDNYPTDWNAIGDWYNNGRAAGEDYQIITDGRTISSYWAGRWQGEGTRLSKNYYENMKTRGGGLFLGTDHSSFQTGINSINDRIGIERFHGNFSLSFIPVDTQSPLMTFPNDMGATLFDDSSPGQTPFGLQPNGEILYSLAWHSGNVNTPGISSTIRGNVGFQVDITSPIGGTEFFDGEPVTFSVSQINGAGPFTYTWTSDVDGELGTGESIDVSTLSVGTHLITLLGEDAGTGGADTGVVSVTIQPVANLAPSDLSAPSIAEPGRQIEVNWTTRNVGSAAATAGWHEAVYFSTDDQLDAGDTLLGSFGNDGSLPAGDPIDISLSVNLPDVSDGDYWLFAVSDDQDDVFEVDEANNSVSVQIQINAAPTITSIMPNGHVNTPIGGIALELSEPVVGNDARNPDSYTLLNLGTDRAPGGGDDVTVNLTPNYSDGATQIDLLAVGTNTVDLNNWVEQDFSGTGNAGDWRVQDGGNSVTQVINGNPTFFVSDFDLIDARFKGLMTVQTTGDDDYMGLAFGYQFNDTTNIPDSYYLMAWKQGLDNLPLRSGFFLAKVTNASGLSNDDYTAQENTAYATAPGNESNTPNIELLFNNSSSSNTSLGWRDNVEYEFDLEYLSDGTINITILDTRNGSVVQDISVVDPDPLGSGRIAFYNRSQAAIRYRGLSQFDFLSEGAYQLTVRSGDPGLRDAQGTALDGDGDNVGGDDFVATFVVDQTPPEVGAVTIASHTITVQYIDNGGMNVATVEDISNYALRTSGGDGTLEDGNEVDRTGLISDIAYDPDTGIATLNLSADFGDELFELTIDGTSTVADLAGNPLQGGQDHVAVILRDTEPSTVAVAITAASDSGVSDSDNITNVTAPTFHVTVNRAGLLEVDFEGDGTIDSSGLIIGAGTAVLTGPQLADGQYTAVATLTPAVGDMVEGELDFTIDTQGPKLEQQVTGQTALQFDGSGDHVNLGNDVNLQPTDAVTIEAWINPISTNSNWPMVLGKWSGGGSAETYYLSIRNLHLFGEITTTVSGNVFFETSADFVELNQWQHVALTFDSGARELRLYHNGQLAQTFGGITGSLVTTGDGPTTIGTLMRNTLAHPFQGQIDEVRLWDVARSEADIRADMNRSLAGNEAGLIGYWPLNEGQGADTQDDSINDNAGSLGGGNGILAPQWVEVDRDGIGVLDLDFNSGVDQNGNAEGDLVFTGPGGFEVLFTDDDSDGAFGGDANGVHITNLNHGNIKVGLDDLVLGALNSFTGPNNWHSSGIVARFSQGVERVNLFDTDNDGTFKTLFAFDETGALIGQTDAGTMQSFSIDTTMTGGALIHSIEFDAEAGTAGGSLEGIVFTIDDFQVQYAIEPTRTSVPAPFGQRRFVFDEPIDESTFTVDDITIQGPNFTDLGSPDSLTGSGDTYTAAFGPFSEPGNYRFNVGPDVADLAGNTMDATAVDTVEILPDTTGPVVVGFEPMGLVNHDVSMAQVTFNEAVLATSFDSDDVLVTTPSGTIDPSQITVTPIDEATFEITFPTHSQDGDYTVEIGPDITDLAGNPMNDLGRANSTVLTFEPRGADGAAAVQAYGDRVVGVEQDGFQYGSGGTSPFTPNVTVSYGPGVQGARRWGLSYGDLEDILWKDEPASHLEVVLEADSGSLVALHGFDLAGWPDVDYVINRVEVLDSDGQPVFSQDNVLIQGDFDGPRHTSFDFAGGLVSEQLTIRFDSSNLGGTSDNIGIDNIEFSQLSTGIEGSFVGSFTIDQTGPAVVSMTPNGEIDEPIETVEIAFTEAIDASSFSVEDVSLVFPGGTVIGGIRTVIDATDVSPTADPAVFTVSFLQQVNAGPYTVSTLR